MTTLTSWNSSSNTPEDALKLPKGRLAADFGILVEQSVNPERVLEAAIALVNSDIQVIAGSQAHVMSLAQENEVAFLDWAARIVTIG